MFVYGTFILVCERNDLIQKCRITGFGNIFVYSWEEPESIVCPIGRMSGCLYVGSIIRRIFMSLFVMEFYKWKSAAVTDLSRKHKTDFVTGHFRIQMNDSLDILDGVPVTISVSKSAIYERCGP